MSTTVMTFYRATQESINGGDENLDVAFLVGCPDLNGGGSEVREAVSDDDATKAGSE